MTQTLDAHPEGMGGEGYYVDLLQASGSLPDEPLQKVELQALVHRTIQELPPNLREVSRPFFDLAHEVIMQQPRNPERTVALRKLLESKDAAVRAALTQG